MAVIDGAYETKGTHLYFINDDLDEILRLTCPTAITGVNGGTGDRINTTCLDNTTPFRTSIRGYADPSEVPVPFILYEGDASQEELNVLHASGRVTQWMVALSDSTEAPTLSSDYMIAPTGRATKTFNGYISNLTYDFGDNEVVRGTLTIQPSGATTHQAAV